MIHRFCNLKMMNKVLNAWYTLVLRKKIAPPTLTLPSVSDHDSETDFEECFDVSKSLFHKS